MNSPTLATDPVRQALRAGRFAEAEQAARQLAQQRPDDPLAWEALTDALLASGDPVGASTACERLVRLLPNNPVAHLKMADVLLAQRRPTAAAAALRRVLELRPGDVDVLLRLGVLLAETGQLSEALMHLRQAAVLAPEMARAHHNLGVALADAGRQDEAEASLRRALELEPSYPEAHFNLGGVLADLGRIPDSLASLRRALSLRPEYPAALDALGRTLGRAGQRGEAVVILEQAIRLAPLDPWAHNQLGLALAELGRFDRAAACYKEALRLAPLRASFHANLGSAYKEIGRAEEAIACYDLAVSLDEADQSARYNRALTLLQSGDWARGWREYEHRWGRKKHVPRPFQKPRWDGSSIEGGRLLVWMEQGTGDMIQFLRFAPLAAARGCRVVVECPRELVPLFGTRAGLESVVAEGDVLPDFDAQVPLMSLPGLLASGPHEVPAGPYLSADPPRVERWRATLGAAGPLRVGIAWQGNPLFQWDHWRSAPLRAFAPLAAVGGVELVSLQKGPGEEQLDQPGIGFSPRRLEGLDANGGAFLDTAAVIACLDLVVCVDTSVGHVAGALGVPCWLALSAVSDWRWLREGKETYWYPKHRLFRQGRLDDWAGVFARVAAELSALVEGGCRAGALRVEVSAGEYLDRLSIARLKAERIADAGKRPGVAAELAALEAAGSALVLDAETVALAARLAEVNGRLWDVEDQLRDHETARDFSGRFVELARSVYRLNDERGALKRALSERLGATWAEEKQYGGRG